MEPSIPSAPTKPFPGYKWRWASVAPTESLNDPPVFLGVLRALCKHEGKAPSSPGLLKDLEVIQRETRTRVDLVRTPDRNLMRNSGQYWKAPGLIADTQPIKLTDFGRAVCDGKITSSEFAATVVSTLTLPNPSVQDDIGQWKDSGLQIQPLRLVLDILAGLKAVAQTEAYLTLEELTRIIIPLAGSKAKINEHVGAVLAVRQNILDISSWPNCTPASNDHRIAKEFLLFLAHYEYCGVEKGPPEKFVLADVGLPEVRMLQRVSKDAKTIEDAVRLIRETPIPDLIDRRRVLRESAERPYQQAFRRNVLLAANGECLLTGVRLHIALEAAHIIPVEHKGSDKTGNGVCLRKDVHKLFDNKHIRIRPDGGVFLSDVAASEATYKALPKKIAIPTYIGKPNLEWRWRYL